MRCAGAPLTGLVAARGPPSRLRRRYADAPAGALFMRLKSRDVIVYRVRALDPPPAARCPKVVAKVVHKMTRDYRTGRQSEHLHMSDAEFNRRMGAVADAFGLDWLSAGDAALQALWQRKDGFAVNQLCLLGDAIAGFSVIDPKWVQDHVGKLKDADANSRRGSMFELLGGNLFRHVPQLIVPTKRNNPGYDFLLTVPDGATADLSLKGYGTSYHEAMFRDEAAKTEQALFGMLRERGSVGAVLLAVAKAYPGTTDWEVLRTSLGNLQIDQAVPRGIWSVKLGSLPRDFAPYSPHHLSHQVFFAAPFHKNESKNLSDKFDEAFANAERHAAEMSDHVRIVLMRVPETISLHTCDRWAKVYLADNPASPIDGIYLYQLAIVEQPSDQSVIGHALCISETRRFAQWRAPPGQPRRGFSLNLAVGTGTPPSGLQLLGGATPQTVEEAYHYQRGDYYRLYAVDPNKPTNVQIRNLASGIFQHAVLQSPEGHMSLAGIFPPLKDIALFD